MGWYIAHYKEWESYKDVITHRKATLAEHEPGFCRVISTHDVLGTRTRDIGYEYVQRRQCFYHEITVSPHRESIRKRDCVGYKS